MTYARRRNDHKLDRCMHSKFEALASLTGLRACVFFNCPQSTIETINFSHALCQRIDFWGH